MGGPTRCYRARVVHAPARLKDVALLAGVSVKTVSNVVNDFPHVRPATRAKVQEALDQLGYRPNLTARSLRSGRTGMIALAVPALDAPYFSELASQVVRAAAAQDWTVLVEETGGDRTREREAAAGLRGQLIDGVLLSPLALRASDLAGAAGTGPPLVLLGERLGSGPADHVAVDNEAAARELVEHLIARGRTRIGVIGAQRPGLGHTARLRIKGYRAALAAAGLPHDPDLVVQVSEWRRQHGAAGARQLLALAHRPDAIFCLNDLLAIGAVRTLADAGLRVPEDIAVVGFDDIEESRYAVPTLTTVAPDKPAIARHAVELLARRLQAEPAGPAEEVTVAHTLRVRESSGG
jgi:DNA-binding LacI/PurR family transcriptional regulator